MGLEEEQKHQQWKKRMELWKGSGKSQAEFCRINRIDIKRFGYWHRKLKKEEPQESGRFVEIGKEEERFFEITLRGGTVVVKAPISYGLRKLIEELDV